MTAAAISTGPCSAGCGRIVRREAATGMLAAALNRVPLVCDECDARHTAELDAAAAARARRQRMIQTRQRIGSSGLPLELRGVTLDELDAAGCAAAIDAAREWAAGGRRGVMLTGPFGTGKTTIAAGALLLVLRRSPGRWVSAPQLMARLGAGLGSQQREWALDLLEARYALVLDDLDKTRPSEYGAEQTFLAVDNAVSRGQRLLVTTNLNAGQLAARWPAPFGEAIASRLAGYCAGVMVAGPDRRLTGRGAR